MSNASAGQAEIAAVPSGRQPSKRLDILLFAAVPTADMLNQGFYAAEADGLRAHPDVRSVATTNRVLDVWSRRYDGLVSYFYSHSAATSLIARLRGKRALVTGGGEQVFRGTMSSAANYWLRLAGFQLTAANANRLFATSTSDRERMRDIAWCGREKIELSFHGAPAVDSFDRSNFESSRPPGALVTICGMDTEQNVRRKGGYEAVELLARFAGVYPDASLTVIGRTTRKDLLEKRARELGVAERLRFSGYVAEDEKLEILEQSHHYVQLSEYEGFGIGALEALAQGCHVIHSGMGGLQDTIGEFGTVLARDQIADFDPRSLPSYKPDLDRLARHLGKFRVRRRADAIVAALRNGAS